MNITKTLLVALLIISCTLNLFGCAGNNNNDSDPVSEMSAPADSENNAMSEATFEEKLTEKLISKNYNDLQKKYIYEVYRKLDNNYDSYFNLYSAAGLPPKYEYLEKHLLEPLDNIMEFNLTDINSEKGQSLINDGSALGWMTRLEPDLPMYSVDLIYGDNDGTYDAERLYHEITHVQNGVVINGEFYNDDTGYLPYRYDIFIEGQATFHEHFVNNPYSHISASELVRNSAGNTIFYGKQNGIGYIQPYNLYANILLLVGYDTMEKLSETADLSVVENALREQYLPSIANDILNAIEANITVQETSDLRFNNCLRFQNAVLAALETKVKQITTAPEMEQFLKFYKEYQYYLLPRIFETDDQFSSKEITYDFFNMDDLEDSIIEKSLQLGVIGGDYSNNEELAVFKAKLFSLVNIQDNISTPVTYDEIEVVSVTSVSGKYYVKLGYTDITWRADRIVEYVLDSDYNITDISLLGID